MLSSAKQEILEVFCTSTDTYSNLLLGLTEEHVVDSEEKQQEEERGGAQLLKQMAATPGLSARIIAPDNNIIIKELKQRIPKEHSSQQDKIQIQFYQPHLHFKVPTMLIVDQKESLLLEMMDDEKNQMNLPWLGVPHTQIMNLLFLHTYGYLKLFGCRIH
jgi:hypothetical protein